MASSSWNSESPETVNIETKGKLLVIAQTACCMILIFWAWRSVVGDPWLIAGVVAGVAVGISAIVAMRVSEVRVTPEPGDESELCERGIYRVIRHPMYAGLLLGMAMFAIPAGFLVGGVTWLILLRVLLEKIRMEEKLWMARDSDYGDYMKGTKRLLPGVW